VRAFVTGGTGFVGQWLRRHLHEAGDDVTAPGHELDVTDQATLASTISDAQPDALYHLAGLTHVGRSWEAPEEYFSVNAQGTLNLLEAARRCQPLPRVLIVSSAEIYGTVKAEELPVREDAPLRPVSPYAASKAAAELLALQAHLGWGLPVVRARPFNHVGPGQDPTFVVPALAERIREASAGGGRVRVGNLSPRRDFTDVRDVVRAYRLLVEHGEAGEAYNVCSGKDVAIEEVVNRLVSLCGAAVELQTDPALMRPVDVPVLLGDYSRLKAATGWEPRLTLDESLTSVLDSIPSG
jgi:GDP-4-dehydro-6-deoxy-D-mannose reductase